MPEQPPCRSAEGGGRGLSRFSSDENGTVPFKAEGGRRKAEGRGPSQVRRGSPDRAVAGTEGLPGPRRPSVGGVARSETGHNGFLSLQREEYKRRWTPHAPLLQRDYELSKSRAGNVARTRRVPQCSPHTPCAGNGTRRVPDTLGGGRRHYNTMHVQLSIWIGSFQCSVFSVRSGASRYLLKTEN